MFKKFISFWAANEKIITLIAFAIALVYPLIFSGRYYIDLAIMCLVYSLLSLSLNFITGYCGIVVLGQAGFYGIGAYTSAILLTRFGWSFVVTALMAVAVLFIRFNYRIAHPPGQWQISSIDTGFWRDNELLNSMQ